MIHLARRNATRILSIVMLSALCACSEGGSDLRATKERNTEKTTIAKQATANASQSAATGCDASLWNHVYNPTRLQQLTPCVSVSGTVQESTPDDDGDQHFLLKLDPGQEALLNKRNQKKKGGALVVEIVCANPVTLKKAKEACAGYTNRILKPPVGSHVKVTGTYVIDTHNGWAEVHPVSALQKM